MQLANMHLAPHYYVPKYFKIHELVHPDDYKAQLNTLRKLWLAFDSRLLWTADRFRECFGPIVINNWFSGTSSKYTVNNSGFRFCGLRPMNSTTGAALSQHKFGRALDLHFVDGTHTAQGIIKEMGKLGLFENGDWRYDPHTKYDPFRYITCIERTDKGKPCTWLHIDTRNLLTDHGGIIVLDL